MPRGKRKVGRPEIKLTDDMRKTIVAAISSGLPREFAAKSVGVSARTLQRWLIRGSKARTGIYCQLCREVGQAEAVFVMKGLKTIRKIADGDGEAAPNLQAWTWLLSRLFPNAFEARARSVTAEVKPGKGKKTQLVLVEGPAKIEPPDELP